MAKRNKPKRQTQRAKNIAAWNKEVKRITRWSNKLAKEGLIVDLSTIDLSPPTRITKAKLKALQAVRGKALYSHFNVYAGAWETGSQAHALALTGIAVGQKISQQQIKTYRKATREYVADIDEQNNPDFSAEDNAYNNAVAKLRQGQTPESERALALFIAHSDDANFKRNVLRAEGEVVANIDVIVYNSKAIYRESSYNELISIVLQRPLSLQESEQLSHQ
jgi:hypothetical protein